MNSIRMLFNQKTSEIRVLPPFLMVLFLSACFSDTIGDSTNVKKLDDRNVIDSIMASKFRYMYQLMNIDTFHKDSSFLKIYGNREAEIVFMEKLSGIHCTYPADRLGRASINEQDYINWTYWFFQNRENLKLHRRTKQVFCVDCSL